MNNKSILGQVLSKLITIADISGNSLANAINVDCSVVSRWKTGKRRIPHNSNYLELISNYISKNITTEFQENLIRNIPIEFNISVESNKSSKIQKIIYDTLLVAQQKSYVKSNSSNTNDFKVYQDLSRHENLFNAFNKNYELIIGHKNIINAGMNLLESGLNKPCSHEDPIIVTFLTELDSFSSLDENHVKWNKTLLNLLQHGWNIKHLIRLNENINRNFKIIDNIKIHCLTERYSPYYLRNYNLLPIGQIEFIIVPTVGVLICLGAHNKNRFDSAFLHRDQKTINVFMGLANQTIKQSNALISSSKNLNDTNSILDDIINIEEKNGDFYLLKDNLGIKTMPIDLYKDILLKNIGTVSTEHLKERLSIQERRNENFHKQITKYKFYNVYSKNSIEEFVQHGKYDMEGAPALPPSQRIEHLKHLISLIEKYDNFHIGLLSDNHRLYFNDLYWFVKDYEGAIMYYKNFPKTDDSKAPFSDMKDSKKNHVSVIYEPTIINAFKKYFMNIWDEISPLNKDKDSVISWLNKQIKSIQ